MSVTDSFWNESIVVYPGVDSLHTIPPELGFTINTPWDVNLLRVHLQNPAISFFSTPKSWLSLSGVRVTEFLNQKFDSQTMSGMIGVNANFFDYGQDARKLDGLAISDGEVVSSAKAGFQPLLITKNNQASIDPIVAHPSNAYTAISGDPVLLKDGVIAVPPPEAGDAVVAARTALGVSADGLYLYVLTVDGLDSTKWPQPKWPYYGATVYETAMLLKTAGASDALNVDGGGSTTMARIDAQTMQDSGKYPRTSETDGAFLMNNPHGNDNQDPFQRLVGNCFGIIVNM